MAVSLDCWLDAVEGRFGVFGFGSSLGLQFVGRVAVGLWIERRFLRPSVIVVPVRGSGRRACLSAAGSRVHNPAAPQASSTPASRSKDTGQIKSKINSKVKVKSCDEEPGLRRASTTSGKLARFPRVAGSVSAAAVGEVVRSVPHGRVVSPGGTAPVSGGKVRALAVGWAGGGLVQRELDPRPPAL